MKIPRVASLYRILKYRRHPTSTFSPRFTMTFAIIAYKFYAWNRAVPSLHTSRADNDPLILRFLSRFGVFSSVTLSITNHYACSLFFDRYPRFSAHRASRKHQVGKVKHRAEKDFQMLLRKTRWSSPMDSLTRRSCDRIPYVLIFGEILVRLSGIFEYNIKFIIEVLKFFISRYNEKFRIIKMYNF